MQYWQMIILAWIIIGMIGGFLQWLLAASRSFLELVGDLLMGTFLGIFSIVILVLAVLTNDDDMVF